MSAENDMDKAIKLVESTIKQLEGNSRNMKAREKRYKRQRRLANRAYRRELLRSFYSPNLIEAIVRADNPLNRLLILSTPGKYQKVNIYA